MEEPEERFAEVDRNLAEYALRAEDVAKAEQHYELFRAAQDFTEEGATMRFDSTGQSQYQTRSLFLIPLRPYLIQVNNPVRSWKANFDQYFAIPPYLVYSDNTFI